MQDLFEVLFQRGALARIEDGVVGEVRRRVRLIGGDQPYEFLFGHRLQGVVHAALLAESRDGIGGKLLAAERTRAVSGVNQGLIGKGQQFVVQRVVEVGSQIGSRPAEGRAQVGAADIADEQRVAGEHGVGLCVRLSGDRRPGSRSIRWCGRESRAPAGAVPGKSRVSPSFMATKAYSACGAGAEVDGRAATVAQLEVAGDEIGVEVGEKDVADLEAEFLGVGEVLLDVALRIDDDRRRACLVAQQIGSMGQAAEIVLFENHQRLIPWIESYPRSNRGLVESASTYSAISQNAMTCRRDLQVVRCDGRRPRLR